MRWTRLLLALCLGIYGIVCSIHMGHYIGTGHYWNNPWFYKGHAALFGVIIFRFWPERGASKEGKK